MNNDMTGKITEKYQELSSNITQMAGDYAKETFLTLSSWDEPQRVSYVDQMKRQMGVYKRQLVNLNAGYFGLIAKSRGEKFVAPRVLDQELSTAALRNGVPEDVVYQRPFMVMKYELSQGAEFEKALEAGATRALSTGKTEVQLARRYASSKFLDSSKRMIGYQRVLNGGSNCLLCVTVSTRTYYKEDLLPIHPNCDCSVEPLFESQRADLDSRLDAVYDFQNDLKFANGKKVYLSKDNTRKIMVSEHGELGPVLRFEGHNFRGPDLDWFRDVVG